MVHLERGCGVVALLSYSACRGPVAVAAPWCPAFIVLAPSFGRAPRPVTPSDPYQKVNWSLFVLPSALVASAFHFEPPQIFTLSVIQQWLDALLRLCLLCLRLPALTRLVLLGACPLVQPLSLDTFFVLSGDVSPLALLVSPFAHQLFFPSVSSLGVFPLLWRELDCPNMMPCYRHALHGIPIAASATLAYVLAASPACAPVVVASPACVPTAVAAVYVPVFLRKEPCPSSG